MPFYTTFALTIILLVLPSRIVSEVNQETDSGAERHQGMNTCYLSSKTAISESTGKLLSKLAMVHKNQNDGSQCGISIQVRLINDYKMSRTLCLYKDDVPKEILLEHASLHFDGSRTPINEIYDQLEQVAGFIRSEPNSFVQGYIINKQFYGTIRMFDKYRLYHIGFYVEPTSIVSLYGSNNIVTDTRGSNAVLFEYVSAVPGSHWITVCDSADFEHKQLRPEEFKVEIYPEVIETQPQRPKATQDKFKIPKTPLETPLDELKVPKIPLETPLDELKVPKIPLETPLDELKVPKTPVGSPRDQVKAQNIPFSAAQVPPDYFVLPLVTKARKIKDQKYVHKDVSHDAYLPAKSAGVGILQSKLLRSTVHSRDPGDLEALLVENDLLGLSTQRTNKLKEQMKKKLSWLLEKGTATVAHSTGGVQSLTHSTIPPFSTEVPPKEEQILHATTEQETTESSTETATTESDEEGETSTHETGVFDEETTELLDTNPAELLDTETTTQPLHSTVPFFKPQHSTEPVVKTTRLMETTMLLKQAAQETTLNLKTTELDFRKWSLSTEGQTRFTKTSITDAITYPPFVASTEIMTPTQGPPINFTASTENVGTGTRDSWEEQLSGLKLSTARPTIDRASKPSTLPPNFQVSTEVTTKSTVRISPQHSTESVRRSTIPIPIAQHGIRLALNLPPDWAEGDRVLQAPVVDRRDDIAVGDVNHITLPARKVTKIRPIGRGIRLLALPNQPKDDWVPFYLEDLLSPKELKDKHMQPGILYAETTPRPMKGGRGINVRKRILDEGEKLPLYLEESLSTDKRKDLEMQPGNMYSVAKTTPLPLKGGRGINVQNRISDDVGKLPMYLEESLSTGKRKDLPMQPGNMYSVAKTTPLPLKGGRGINVQNRVSDDVGKLPMYLEESLSTGKRKDLPMQPGMVSSMVETTPLSMKGGRALNVRERVSDDKEKIPIDLQELLTTKQQPIIAYSIEDTTPVMIKRGRGGNFQDHMLTEREELPIYLRELFPTNELKDLQAQPEILYPVELEDANPLSIKVGREINVQGGILDDTEKPLNYYRQETLSTDRRQGLQTQPTIGNSTEVTEESTPLPRSKRNRRDINNFFDEDLVLDDEDVHAKVDFIPGVTDSEVFDLRRSTSLSCTLCLWIQPHFAEIFGLSGGLMAGVAEVLDLIRLLNWIFRTIDFNQDGYPENIGFEVSNIFLTDDISLDGAKNGKSGGLSRRKRWSKYFKREYIEEGPGDSFAQLVRQIEELAADDISYEQLRFGRKLDLNDLSDDYDPAKMSYDNRLVKNSRAAKQDTMTHFSREVKSLPATLALEILSPQLIKKFSGCCAILGFIYHDLTPAFATTTQRGLCSGHNNIGLISGMLNKQKIGKFDLFRGVMHTLGHLFGAPHDNPLDQECFDKNISPFVNPFPLHSIQQLNVGLRPNSMGFSSCALDHMTMFLASNGATCLTEHDKSFCGNGIVEEDEECDCGSPIECALSFPCCQSRDSLRGCHVTAGHRKCFRLKSPKLRNRHRSMTQFGSCNCSRSTAG